MSTKYPETVKWKHRVWTYMQVSYMFIQLVAGCYRYTKHNGADFVLY